jgi:protein subunit release factor B
MPTRSNRCDKCKGYYDPKKGHTCRLLLSITASDMEWDFFRAGGKGGQNQNKRSTGVRCKHLPSGAAGEARDERTQAANRKAAFRRCVETKKFQAWLKIECSRHLGTLEKIEKAVEKHMDPKNFKIEVRENGKWTKTEVGVSEDLLSVMGNR